MKQCLGELFTLPLNIIHMHSEYFYYSHVAQPPDLGVHLGDPAFLLPLLSLHREHTPHHLA